jgi:peptidoglycan/xylan/chitin deacetylase (PgdA/CDA1 family)
VTGPLPQDAPAVLAYHEVMPESTYSYCVPCTSLAQQLQHLKGLASRQGGKLCAQVTFDDGEQSQYLHAFPLLAQYEIPAIFFVTPGLIGTGAKFLGWSRLRELRDAGHSIESHGWSHKFLSFCSHQELAYELKASKQELEDRLGKAVRAISAPGGRWDRRVVEACAVAGYQKLYISDPWIQKTISGVQVVGRLMVRRKTTLAELTRIICRDQRTLWTLRLRSVMKRRLVGAIGDGTYHRLWCRLSGYVDFEQARQKRYS